MDYIKQLAHLLSYLEIAMLEVRKTLSFVEEIRSEAGIVSDPPLRKVAVAAIVKNPFFGRDFQADLSSLVTASEQIGRTVSEAAMQLLAPYSAQSYGKAGIAGLYGEQEHAVALLTTTFGNVVRAAAGGGKAWISSMTKRAAPGATIDVPLACKDALYVRSHYDGISITLHDAPLPDEIAVIVCYANRSRLNERVGGIRFDAVKGEDGLV